MPVPPFHYDLVFSKRRTLALAVYPDGRVIVRAPRGTPRAVIDAFIDERTGWVLRKQGEMRARQPAQALVLREGAQVPVLGQPLHLHIETTPRARPQVTHSDGGLLLAVRSAADVPAVFARWFTQSAQADFAARLAVWEPRAAALGIAGHTALTVRAMKTRWGTCTHTGRITLNRALYHLEPALIDYVVAHELCHRREMNHSARYYLLLDALMPGWPAHRAALRALQPLAWA